VNFEVFNRQKWKKRKNRQIYVSFIDERENSIPLEVPELFPPDVRLQWSKRELCSTGSSRYVPIFVSLAGNAVFCRERKTNVVVGCLREVIQARLPISLSSSSPWRWQLLLDLQLGYFEWKRRHRFNALPVLLHQVSPSRRLKYFYKLVTVWAS
jgi:hypothetical protein